MAKVKVTYFLSKEGQKNAILKGLVGTRKREVEIEFTKEIKDIVNIDSDGNLTYKLEACLNEPTISNFHYKTVRQNCKYLYYDNVFTPDEAYNEILRVKKLNEIYSDKEIELDEQCKIDNEKARLKKEEEDNKKKQEAEEKRLEALKKKLKLNNEKLAWIREHGSQYLKDATELKYDCKRLYVNERAKFEFPDFIVDYDDNASWKDRSTPSEEVINEVKSLLKENKDLEIRVVWLTSIPYDETDEDIDLYEINQFEEREAIVIRNYLGEFDLIKY